MNQDLIDEEGINALLETRPDRNSMKIVLRKARLLKGLDLSDVSVLLNADDPEVMQELFGTARYIKDTIYGNRLVLFAPLYVSDHCSNNCLYCAFRKDNHDFIRKNLTNDDIRKETEQILSQVHKRILMLMGEDSSKYSFSSFLEAIDAAYSAKDGKGSSLRRINVEIAPLTDEEFRVLSTKKIGTYTCFQETYHKETYARVHPSGKKRDYFWRLHVMDRALENGLNDVGIGALFGLYDYRFEVLSLLSHARYLDRKYGAGPHTISVPRIEPAQNAPASQNIPRPVTDGEFRKIVAILRCAVPYTGIILSTRESAELRNELFNLGVSQISAGSRTSTGGYCGEEQAGQFGINDTRSTSEVISSVIQDGFVPSFCTGCYRRGRVGKDFMDLAKPGLIKLHCLPNGLLTLKEYLIDYADEKTQSAGDELILRELSNIPDPATRKKAEEYLARITKGERDLYF